MSESAGAGGGAPLIARIEVPPTVDVASIVAAVNAPPGTALYADGWLAIRGITQAALDAAAEGADTLYAARRAVRSAALIELASKIEAGMPYQGRVVQIDETSRNNINGASLAASLNLLPEGFGWRMKDNSFLALDNAGMLTMGQTVMAYFNALRQRYWTIVDTADAADDAAELAAIDVTAGWPAPPAA